MSDVLAPVQKQLEAYNNKDIETFMSCFAKECFTEDGEGNVGMKTWDEMYDRYKKLFADNPNMHCEIVSRTVVGNYVLDEEHVTGREGQTELVHCVAIYRVEDGLIRHVRFLR